MLVLIKVLTAVVMLEHCYILWLEMFAWTSRGPKVFKQLPAALFPPTKPLAANQGLYNGFLAAGLAWTFFIADPVWALRINIFFLSCVAVAGIYGAVTADRKIFFIQALPALLTLLLITLQLFS